MTTEAHVVRTGEGQIADLGVISMRILASGDVTNREFALAEFAGKAGPWTVLHVHNETSESFFVSAGSFTFTVGDKQIEAKQGDYVACSSWYAAHDGRGARRWHFA